MRPTFRMEWRLRLEPKCACFFFSYYAIVITPVTGVHLYFIPYGMNLRHEKLFVRSALYFPQKKMKSLNLSTLHTNLAWRRRKIETASLITFLAVIMDADKRDLEIIKRKWKRTETWQC